jgi:hypothetical protein
MNNPAPIGRVRVPVPAHVPGRRIPIEKPIPNEAQAPWPAFGHTPDNGGVGNRVPHREMSVATKGAHREAPLPGGNQMEQRWDRPRNTSAGDAGIQHRVWLTRHQSGNDCTLPRPALEPNVPLGCSREHLFFCRQWKALVNVELGVARLVIGHAPDRRPRVTALRPGGEPEAWVRRTRGPSASLRMTVGVAGNERSLAVFGLRLKAAQVCALRPPSGDP